MGSFQIYALCDPRTLEVRYIGKARNAENRLKSHMRDRTRRDYPVYRWINKLASQNLQPHLVILETTSDWREAERRLIALLRARGAKLLNVAEGGDEPHCTPEQRSMNARKLNERLKNDPRLARLRELKRQLAIALRLDRVNNETREKLRLLAARSPRMFGEWAALPNRAE